MELLKTTEWNGRYYYRVVTDKGNEYEIKSIKPLLLSDIEQKAEMLDSLPTAEQLEKERFESEFVGRLTAVAETTPLKKDETIKQWAERVKTAINTVSITIG